MKIPWMAFPRFFVPVRSVPIKLPWITLSAQGLLGPPPKSSIPS